MRTRLSTEDYKEAEELLKRYNQNERDIINIRNDIISINSSVFSEIRGMQVISDTVLDAVIELEKNSILSTAAFENKIVNRALENTSELANKLFEAFYKKKKNKWDVMYETGMSERTFSRKKTELIYATHKELLRHSHSNCPKSMAR